MQTMTRHTPIGSGRVLLLSSVLLGLTTLCHAITLREATDGLVRQLWEGNPPGEVLFSEDFEAGDLDAWRADPNWSIVERGDPPGKSAQVVSSQTVDDIQDLILLEKVPVTPGHPIAVCWRARSLEGTSPLYLRVDFFDADGKTGEPYARQEIGAQGPNWTENTVVVSDWFPPYTRAVTIWFHQSAQSQTTSLLDDIRVVDLQSAAQEIVARELPRYRELARRLPAEADALAASPINDAWKATVRRTCETIGMELDAAAALEPGSQAASEALGRPARYLKALSDAVAGLEAGVVTGDRLLTYRTRPVTSTMILPETGDLPGDPARELSLTACPGEAESASLVLWGPEAVEDLLISATDLGGPTGTLPASCVDIKWVKCWYQAGSAWWGVSQQKDRKVLVPELLLNDDDLVRVDREGQCNELKLSFAEGPRYVPIDDPTPVPWGTKFSLDEFPVKDAPELLPTDLAAGENKQVWVTVTVPPDTAAGDYSGVLRLVAGGQPVGEVALCLRVLPFSLPEPRAYWDPSEPFTYSLYYWGELDPTGAGSIGYEVKNDEQFAAELKAMYDHGIVAPCMIWSPEIVYRDEPLFRKHLQAATDAGMSGRPLYFGDSGMIGNPTDPADLAALRANVERTIQIAAEYGFTEVYFYGLDEATGDRLVSQRGAWRVVHEAGGKVIVSGFHGQFDAMGDLLDLFNRAGNPEAEDPARWHAAGHKVWNYANPQTPPENPELYRRNYGLYLWKLDYDGANTYCFMDSSGFQWNDFDDDTYRDHCLAYPTVDGVVLTLALQGFREGADDVKYATELRQRATAVLEAGPGGLRAEAQAALEWLEALQPKTADLDATREEMVRRIVELGD